MEAMQPSLPQWMRYATWIQQRLFLKMLAEISMEITRARQDINQSYCERIFTFNLFREKIELDGEKCQIAVSTL